MQLRNLCLSFFLISCFNLFAQQEVKVFSPSMQRDILNMVYLPSDYNESKTYPVLYLLHGHGGNYKTWGEVVKPDLDKDATNYQMIIVTPDGQNSWYWDSPIKEDMKFETYVSNELIHYIDSVYQTITSPSGRAIAGFSMGGQGAMHLSINHPDVFGACGSMSGGLDIRPFPNSWNMKSLLGTLRDNTEVWDSIAIVNQLQKIEPNTLSIIIDCGTDDFFYKVNEEVHKKLLYLNIPHNYISRPGGHNREYWNNAIKYQLLYFNDYFVNKKK